MKENEIANSLKFMQRSDIIVKISKTRVKSKLSFLDKLSNIFCFWLPKIVEKENINLPMLKNRRGKSNSF